MMLIIIVLRCPVILYGRKYPTMEGRDLVVFLMTIFLLIHILGRVSQKQLIGRFLQVVIVIDILIGVL